MPDVTLREVARDLGINEGLMGRWRRAIGARGKQAFVGQSHASDQELMRLRRELGKVKQEWDCVTSAHMVPTSRFT